MAKKVKLLYFSVPTRYELEQQVDQLEFLDRFAKRRKRMVLEKDSSSFHLHWGEDP